MKYTFSENNSGGSWWLNRKQYEKLFAAGWKYEPSSYDLERGHDKVGDPFSGDVPYGWRHGLFLEANSIREAVENWEAAIGEDFFAEGCNCCGAPFSISGDDGEHMSGNSVERRTIRPW